jgi:hypothetical protein
MYRKSVGILALVLICTGAVLSGYEVDREELERTGDRHIRFVNYVGPHSKIETYDEIWGIGVALGRRIAAGETRASYFGKYEAEHLVDPVTADGLDADIVSVASTAEVDHVDNLRLILTGFLETVYGYTRRDAELLSEFVSVYNAVYRGAFETLSARYKRQVTDRLDPARAGLSNIYSDWPGGTQLLIPLTDRAALSVLDSIDSEEISDDRVVEVLRDREDMGIDLRKGMVELRERQVDEQEGRLESERERLAEASEELSEEQRAIERRAEELSRQRETLLSQPESPERTEALAGLEDERLELQERETELAARERELADSTDELERSQNEIEARRTAIRQDREEIAADQQRLLRENTAEAVRTVAAGPADQRRGTGRAGSSYFISLVEGENTASQLPLGRIVLIDPETGAQLAASALNTIRGRAWYTFDGKLLVVAGRTDRGGAVRMHLLEPGTLEVLSAGKDDIFPESMVVPLYDAFLAVTGTGSSWNLARFDRTLAVTHRSSVPVNPYTMILVSGDHVLLQGRDGGILSLSLPDLTVMR